MLTYYMEIKYGFVYKNLEIALLKIILPIVVLFELFVFE